MNGTRAAVRTVIRYRQGVLSGRGASLLDGYMEDLATDRIYRLMIAQRMRHRDVTHILDDNGNPVAHTPDFVTHLFDEELARILSELPPATPTRSNRTFHSGASFERAHDHDRRVQSVLGDGKSLHGNDLRVV